MRHLVEARRAAGLSQKQLADRTGVGRSGIVTMEQGRRMPSSENLKRLADGIGVPLAELVARAEKDVKSTA